MKNKVAMLIPYFGEWPEWMNLFVESCRRNRRYDWIIFCDRDPPENESRNVRYIRTSFEAYRDQLSEAVGVKVAAPLPYKLCDIRPALGLVHAELVQDYDFVGFGDLDVIYGRLDAFYDDELLDRFDLLSSHPDRVSGHFCLMRNSEAVTTAFRSVAGWKAAFTRADNVTFDERAFYNLLTGKRRALLRPPPSLNCWFREAYSTPGATSLSKWSWQDGQLTNDEFPHHPFMYLHFMNWRSNRWYADQPGVAADTPAPWSTLPQSVQLDWRDARDNGFTISREGFRPRQASC